MKMTLQVVIEDEDHDTPLIVKEVFSLERKGEELCPETLGLKLDEAKGVLAEIQTALVTAQATRFLEQQSVCPDCGMPYRGHHNIDAAGKLLSSLKSRVLSSYIAVIRTRTSSKA